LLVSFKLADLPLTEKLDYFSAALAIGYGLYYTVIRFFHLYPNYDTLATPSLTSRRSIYLLWSLLCIIVYVAHISYLTLLPRFDYAYNMAFNLTVGLSHNALWLLYSLPASIPLFRRFPSKPKSYRPTYATKAALFVALTTAATALELFDFPPWARVIDAHSLWHLSTAPIAMFWFRFLVEDALDDGWRGNKT
jgi:post-GPI attachment to proteins factor 3